MSPDEIRTRAGVFVRPRLDAWEASRGGNPAAGSSYGGAAGRGTAVLFRDGRGVNRYGLALRCITIATMRDFEIEIAKHDPDVAQEGMIGVDFLLPHGLPGFPV
jgi:hypothetical protein